MKLQSRSKRQGGLAKTDSKITFAFILEQRDFIQLHSCIPQTGTAVP